MFITAGSSDKNIDYLMKFKKIKLQMILKKSLKKNGFA